VSGTLWVPGAERVPGPHSRGGTMAGGPPRMVHHITWDALDRYGRQPKFDNVRNYLVNAGYEPTLMICPFTGRIVQFLPANRAAYALANKSGGVETNRMGKVNIQVEWFFTPGCVVDGRKHTDLTETPMRGLDAVMALADSWGIPAVWPAGVPNWRSQRSANTWRTRTGHFGHSQVVENSHTDPGPIRLATQEEEDDMPVSEEQIDQIAAEAAARAFERINPSLSLILHGSDKGHVGIDQLKAQLDALAPQLATGDGVKVYLVTPATGAVHVLTQTELAAWRAVGLISPAAKPKKITPEQVAALEQAAAGRR
jgi:hypothetical protein